MSSFLQRRPKSMAPVRDFHNFYGFLYLPESELESESESDTDTDTVTVFYYFLVNVRCCIFFFLKTKIHQFEQWSMDRFQIHPFSKVHWTEPYIHPYINYTNQLLSPSLILSKLLVEKHLYYWPKTKQIPLFKLVIVHYYISRSNQCNTRKLHNVFW